MICGAMKFRILTGVLTKNAADEVDTSKTYLPPYAHHFRIGQRFQELPPRTAYRTFHFTIQADVDELGLGSELSRKVEIAQMRARDRGPAESS